MRTLGFGRTFLCCERDLFDSEHGILESYVPLKVFGLQPVVFACVFVMDVIEPFAFVGGGVYLLVLAVRVAQALVSFKL